MFEVIVGHCRKLFRARSALAAGLGLCLAVAGALRPVPLCAQARPGEDQGGRKGEWPAAGT